MDVAVTFTLAPGLAEPRDSFTVYLETTPTDVGGLAVTITLRTPTPNRGREPSPGAGSPCPGGERRRPSTFAFVVHPGHRRSRRMRSSYMQLRAGSGNLPMRPTIPVIPQWTERTTISILDDDPLVVTDVEVTSTSTNSYYGVGDMIEFTVTFTAISGGAEADHAVRVPTGRRDPPGGVCHGRRAKRERRRRRSSTPWRARIADDGDGISWGANALQPQWRLDRGISTPRKLADPPKCRPGPRRAGGAAGPEGGHDEAVAWRRPRWTRPRCRCSSARS